MVKFYLSILICFSFSLRLFSQEPERHSDQSVKQFRIQSMVLPFPVMRNTGNSIQDSALFLEDKEKWISGVLSMYSSIISHEQLNHLREVLLIENSEDVLRGKVLIPIPKQSQKNE